MLKPSIEIFRRDTKKMLLTFACCFISLILFVQHDFLILKNGNVIVGELKSMNKGVITIETDYSKNDFTIEWLGVKEIYSTTRFLITLTDGRRINGTVKTAAEGQT